MLFLGSSRVLATIDPKIILSYNIKSENLGTHGQGIRFAIARYQNYLAKNPKSPKIIVCSLEPVFESGFSSFMKDRYSRYCWNSNPMDSQILNYFKFDWFERNIPMYAILKYRKLWDCIFLNNQSSWLNDGMEHRDGDICDKINPISDFGSIRYNLVEMESQVSRLQNLAINNGSKLIFLQLPFYNIKGASKNNGFELTENICKKFKVDFINFYTDDLNNNCSIFADPYHFNAKGSGIITKAVVKELQRYKH